MIAKTTINHALNIAVAGGKGGVGKTSVALALVQALKKQGHKLVLQDCDVENPNCHLFLKKHSETSEPVTIEVPRVKEDLCTHCGQCADFCQFNALADVSSQLLVFEELCHGCGGCLRLCPEKALEPVKSETGQVMMDMEAEIPHVYGLLKIGNARTTTVIDAVRQKSFPDTLTVIDAAPGTGCAAVAGVKDADAVILVTEPTPFGLHDLTLSVSVMKDMGVPFGVVVNRMEPGRTAVRDYCLENNVPVLMEIPFSLEIARACANGEGILDVMPEFHEEFQEMFRVVKGMIS